MPNTRGICAREAIYKGFIPFTGKKEELEQVIISGKLEICGHDCTATLRDLLLQEDFPGFDNFNDEAHVCCDYIKSFKPDMPKLEQFCGGKVFVTLSCQAKTDFRYFR